ncbi:MAG TPA: phenylalanine--tRNA ligase beta subunit-related protein [Polyangiales bacterium]
MHFELDHETLRLGLVYAGELRVEPSPPALLAALGQTHQALRDDPARFPEATRVAIRDMLRRGGYKPTGRGKPASEYLLGQVLSGGAEGVARINNLVDINNLISLRHALPISVLDADLLGPDVAVRFGRADERYVFNQSGQSMDIAGLPVICRGAQREPVGNAVKDSMLCKVHPGTDHALFVVYGSRALPADVLGACLNELGELLQRHLSAKDLASVYVPE